MRTTTRNDISNLDDLIDVRDVIARVEELREEVSNIDDMPEGDQLKNTAEGAAIRDELKVLEALLEECRGNGGDEEIAYLRVAGGSEEQNRINAAFIVRACNSHAALLEALEALTEECASGNLVFRGYIERATLEAAQAALKLAKGEA